MREWGPAMLVVVVVLVMVVDPCVGNYVSPTDIYRDNYNPGTYGVIQDINGDQLPDFILSHHGKESGDHSETIYLNNGCGFVVGTTWETINYEDRYCPTAQTRVLTVEGAAVFLKISREEVVELIERGEIRGLKVKDGYRISMKALEEKFLS